MANKPNKNDNGSDGDKEYLLHVLSFNGTRWSFDEGYVIVIELRESPVTRFRPLGFSYAFNLFGPDAHGDPKVRLYAFDNAHAPDDAIAPYDHEHQTQFGPGGHPVGTGKPKSRPMGKMDLSIAEFFEKCSEKLTGWGVDVGAGVMTTAADEPKPAKNPAKGPAKKKGGASRAHSTKKRKTK